jgi:hypothetical protein
VVVLLTPDDQARLRPDLLNAADPPYEKTLTGQARPNVIFEGGMAWVSHRDRTVLIQIGDVRPFSDVSGLHILRLNNNVDKRQEFAYRLQDAKCPIDLSGSDWHTAGDLNPPEAVGELLQVEQPTNRPAIERDDPFVEERRRVVEQAIGKLGPEKTEALYIIARDGVATDRYALSQLQQKGLAYSWAGVYEGLASETNFLHKAPGQDARTIRMEERQWVINTEVRQIVLDYFKRSRLRT